MYILIFYLFVYFSENSLVARICMFPDKVEGNILALSSKGRFWESEFKVNKTRRENFLNFFFLMKATQNTKYKQYFESLPTEVSKDVHSLSLFP